VFGRKKRKEEQAINLVQSGSVGVGTLTNVADTGITINELDIRVKLTLRIDPIEGAGRRPLEVELQSLNAVQLGRAGESFPPGVWKTRSEGPERISGGWWAGGSAREYWRVESPDGWLGVMFRDAASGGWFVEGWFD